MTRQDAFATLRTILADIYPGEPTARRVAQDVGLELHRVAFSGAANNIWNSILAEAENANKMEDVFRVVLSEYDTNPDLRKAIDDYRHQTKDTSIKLSGQSSELTVKLKNPVYFAIADQNPKLALIGLWLEVGNRLRLIAAKHGLQDQPIIELVRSIANEGLLDESSIEGLLELVLAGDRALSGAEVEQVVVQWALENSPRILASLDATIVEPEHGDYDDWLRKALTILEFEGQQATDFCINLLVWAQREGHVLAPVDYSVRAKAADVLARLGALLEEIDNPQRKKRNRNSWRKFRISTAGRKLLAQLLMQYELPMNRV